jgi:hypothetical protein
VARWLYERCVVVVKQSERRVLRAAAEVLAINGGNWPGNDLVGEHLGGVDAGVVAQVLRTLQDKGYLRLDGGFSGSGGERVFVQEINPKGHAVLGTDEV